MPNSLEHALLINDATSDWLGIEVLSLSDGKATIAMTLRPEMMNGFGMTHGGMVFSLADTAFALACNSAQGHPETITVASGADVTFLRSTYAGQRLIATAERRQQQGRSGLYDVQVRVDSSADSSEHDAGASGSDANDASGGTASTNGASGSAGSSGPVVAEFRGRSRTIPNRAPK